MFSISEPIARARLLRIDPTLYFAVVPLLSANFAYLFLMLFYSVSRAHLIAITATVIFAGLFLNRYVFLALLLIVTAFDALAFISAYFQMPLPMLLDSIRFFDQLNFTGSPTYLGAVAALILSVAITFRAVQSARKHRAELKLWPFALVLTCLCGADWWLTLSPQKTMHLKRTLTEAYGPIDDSAATQTGLDKHILTRGNDNVLIVMVEGLGAFVSQEQQDLIWGPLLENDITRKYESKSGITAYFGSTTSAETRELCNLKADYTDFRERADADCLPEQATKKGYETAAFHAFSGEFFERWDWFPKIGFQELYFLDNNIGLSPDVALPRCGITFRGLCDTDVATEVQNFMTSKIETAKFAYWLTLNSHKPVMPGEAPSRLMCSDGGVFNDRELCLMAEHWLNVSHLVRDIALDPQLSDTRILLVGDHHPPLFTRKARNNFQPGYVAWLYLEPREHQSSKHKRF